MNKNGQSIGIVGAGVVGVCAALMLQRRGHNVTLFDPELPGSGASFGNAGCLNAASIVPMSMPGMLASIPRWLMDPLGPLSIRWRYLPTAAPWLWHFLQSGRPNKILGQSQALRDLLGESVPLMTSLADEAGARQLIRSEGHLYVYRNSKALAKDEGGWALRRAAGVELQTLTADEIRRRDPSISHEFTRGIFVPENGHTLDPYRLVNSLFLKVLAQGGKYIGSRVRSLKVDRGKITSITTSNEEIAVDGAVIAAGAHSKPFASMLGDSVPLDTERGYHIFIRKPGVMPLIPTTDAEAKYIATPMLDGLRISGTVELAGLKAPPNWDRAHALFSHAKKLLPGLGADGAQVDYSVWMGFRPSMPDSLPVIGPSRLASNVIYAFGHGHVGMTGAPKTAEVVAQLLSGEKPSIDTAPFAAGRWQ